MSSQKGNASRSRPQKYQNRFAFKNNLHDTSHMTKRINNVQVVNVCERCKNIIEWKIKYKKFKPLKAPSKCTKCDQKTVKHAYHIMCSPCARERNVCPKCGTESELVGEVLGKDEFEHDKEMQILIKKLSERRRRTFMRYMKKKIEDNKEAKSSNKKGTENEKEKENKEDKEEIEKISPESLRDDLLSKLKSLMLDDSKRKKDSDEDEFSDFSDESESNFC